MRSSISLGATLYMPATRMDLWQVVSGEKFPELRSLVICLEDAVAEQDVEDGKIQLKKLLFKLKHEARCNKHPMVFIRPRHLEMAKELAQWTDIEYVDGMVLPKFGIEQLITWQQILPPSLDVMPTLETAPVFDMSAMRELRQALQTDFRRVLMIRIGGNDLLNCLSIRRPFNATLYQTPLSQLIANLAGQFLPFDFSLSAPVFEHFSQIERLQEEIELDIQHGLTGKTVIHPSQITYVHQAYQVSEHELSQAQDILAIDAKAVFSNEGSMLEPATHRRWAEKILQRATHFGVKTLLPSHELIHSPSIIFDPQITN